MPTFKVYGADAETGEERVERFHADTVPDAEAIASARRVMVSRMVEVEESESTPAAPVAAARTLNRYGDARPSQALPALANVFLPGVGQLIQGRIKIWLMCWLMIALWLVLVLNYLSLQPSPAGLAGLGALGMVMYLGIIVESARWDARE